MGLARGRGGRRRCGFRRDRAGIPLGDGVHRLDRGVSGLCRGGEPAGAQATDASSPSPSSPPWHANWRRSGQPRTGSRPQCPPGGWIWTGPWPSCCGAGVLGAGQVAQPRQEAAPRGDGCRDAPGEVVERRATTSCPVMRSLPGPSRRGQYLLVKRDHELLISRPADPVAVKRFRSGAFPPHWPRRAFIARCDRRAREPLLAEPREYGRTHRAT